MKREWGGFIGEQYKTLTITGYEMRQKKDKRRPSGFRTATFFVCRCTCGKVGYVEPYLWGKQKSCGCMQRAIRKVHKPHAVEPLFIHGIPAADYLMKWRAEQALARAERDCRKLFCHQVSRSSYL
jgi:hypothetical protein